MTVFLDYLNNASAEELTQLAGLTSVQVESILSARPIASLEDCSRISELSKKKLEKIKLKWQESQQTGGSTEPESTAQNVIIESEPQPTEPEPVEEQAEPEEEPSDSLESEPELRQSGKAGRVIGRVVILLIILAAIAGIIYFGAPWLYDKYIRPVKNNTESLTNLTLQQETSITNLEEEISTLKNEIKALQSQISTLENRTDTIDQSLEDHARVLSDLEAMQLQLETQLSTQNDSLLLQLNEQLKMTRAIELISRSRLYLSQSNFGLAKTDLQAGRKLLYAMLDTLPEDQVNAMKIVIERLDLAIENLPAYPVVAVYDVDTAWQLLVDGLPNVPDQITTPIVLPEEETATPEPAELFTVTPEGTETGAVTPTR